MLHQKTGEPLRLLVFLFVAVYFNLSPAISPGSEHTREKAYARLVISFRGDRELNDEAPDLNRLVALFLSPTPAASPEARLNAAFHLAEQLDEDNIPLDELLKLARSETEGIESRVLAVILLAKGTLSRKLRTDTNTKLFELARDRSQTDQVRSAAFMMLLGLTSSPNAALRECTRLLSRADTSPQFAKAVGQHLYVATAELRHIPLDAAATCVLSSLDAARTEDHRAVLMQILATLETHDDLTEELNDQTRIDMHRFGEAEFKSTDSDKARILGASFIEPDLELSAETISLAKHLSLNPETSPEMKKVAATLLKRIDPLPVRGPGEHIPVGHRRLTPQSPNQIPLKSANATP